MRASVLVLALLLTALSVSPALAQPRSGAVELIEAGQPPTRPLRHRFSAGQRQRLRLRMQTQMRVQVDGRDASVPVPIMRIDLDLGPTQIVNGGNLRYDFRIAGVGVDGEAEEQVVARAREQLQGIVGLHGTAEVDDRGAIVAFDYDLPEDATPQLRNQSGMLRRSLTQLLPRFPEEPVGVGAEWRIRDELALPEMRAGVATTYRLTRWEGDRVELRMSTRTLEGGERPQNASLEVGGSGRTSFELGSLRVRGRVQTVAAFEASGPGGQVRMRVRMRTQITPR